MMTSRSIHLFWIFKSAIVEIPTMHAGWGETIFRLALLASGNYIYIFFSLQAGGIQQILQSDWLLEQADGIH